MPTGDFSPFAHKNNPKNLAFDAIIAFYRPAASFPILFQPRFCLISGQCRPETVQKLPGFAPAFAANWLFFCKMQLDCDLPEMVPQARRIAPWMAPKMAIRPAAKELIPAQPAAITLPRLGAMVLL